MTGIKVAKQAIPLNPMDAIKTGFLPILWSKAIHPAKPITSAKPCMKEFK
jgi:hypothetical protein